MARRRFLPLGLVVTLFGCAEAATDPTLFGSDTGLPRVDSGAPRDTGSIGEDTGSTEEDTGTSKDSATSDTSSPADSTATDSTASDSTASDSTATDSTAADTTTGMDTSVVTDTSVVMDTSIEDTAPSETGGGTRILTGTSLVLHGTTTDNYVIVSDSAGNTSAVPLGGGAPITVAGGSSMVTVSNSVVFSWGAADTFGFAPLRVWTAANGLKSIATKSIVPSSSATFYVATASKDGAYVFFTDGAIFGSTTDTADIKVAKTDGTGIRTVFPQYVTYGTALAESCAPYAGWVGTRFVTTHCTPMGTSESFDVSSIDPATGMATTLGTDIDAYWSADDAGTKVAVVATGSLRVLPVAGGTPTIIDTGVASAYFTHDGTAVVYRTTGSALKRSSVTAPAPTTLVASGAASILSLPSPNDQWMLYAGVTGSGGSDIRRASLSGGGSTTLHAATNGAVFSSGFTADSAYAVYYTNVTTAEVGTLTAYPSAGGSPLSLGTNAWIDIAVAGSKIAFNDNYATTSTGGNATIRVRDIAGTTTTTIATANRNFTLSPAKDKVIYTTTDGLYVAPVP